ncbi:TSYL5 protein, partial [Tachuris rubrigastra]|nr:TSYL5 protein [Tachuris rubrigastra]
RENAGEGPETPEEGMETPVKGMKSPKEGMETPEDEKKTPKDEMETLKDGPETLKKGVETPVRGLKTPKKGLKTIMDPREDLEATVTPCLEQENGDLETTNGLKESLETTREAMGDLETTVIPCLDQDVEVLETPLESKGNLETTMEVPGSTNGCRGSLETAVSRCLEQGRRSKGGLETTSKAQGGLESDVPPTSRRKAGLKTPGRAKGSVETAGTQCLDWERSRNGSLETPKEGMETTSKAQGELESDEAEESAVISVGEEEEEEEEEGEEEEGPGRYLAALEAVQLQLEAVEEEAARAFRRLHARFGLRRRPHLQRRNRLIQHIPGFWVTAFLNHPQLSAMISDRDEDALSYMTSLQVEEFGQSRPGCRIRFFFSINPYFQNDVVAKEFVRGPSGHLVSHSTPIRWWQGQDPRSRPHKGPPGPRSFFAWFGDHSFPAGDRVAEIIKEELWPNPLQFYLLGERAEGPLDSESGEDCVVIEDDDEDVQEIPDDGDGQCPPPTPGGPQNPGGNPKP